MALLKFERTSAPTGSITFSRNPAVGGYGQGLSYLQPMDFADGGDLYVYNKGNVRRLRTLSWDALPVGDWTNLQAFLEVVQGASYNFTFRDYTGTTYTARFYNPSSFEAVFRSSALVSLSIEIMLEE